MPLTSHSVDKSYLKFIFNEDLYLVKEQRIIEKPEAILPAVQEPEPILKRNSEKKSMHYKVGIVVESEKEISINKDFLTKILQAVNMSWSDAGIITKDSLNKDAHFENYLVFGIEPQNLIPYNSSIFLNQTLQQDLQKFIFTYSLSDLEKNKDKKKGLWNAMQEAFLK